MKISAFAVFTAVLISSAVSTAPASAQTLDAASGVNAVDISPVDRTYDHLKCYKIRDPLRLAALARLHPLQDPPFSVEPGCRIKITAREFCIPVHKEVRESLHADLSFDDLEALVGSDQVHDFLCYNIRCPRGDVPNGWPVADQFGRRVVRGFKPKRLCTPARKLHVDQRCCAPADEPVCPQGQDAECCIDGSWACPDPLSNEPACTIDEGRVCRRCCDPSEEPGVDGNPLCFEGHTCCANGRWQCNDAGAQSTCAVDGTVCENCCPQSLEPGQGGNPICFEGHTCCSDGTWQCNGASGEPSCDLTGQACSCCNPREEPGQFGNPICIEGATCCANGGWRCNDAGGQSTCDYDGETCPLSCGGFSGVQCPADQICRLREGQCCCDFEGVCEPLPDTCPQVIDRVCGCDGNTYGNECLARAAGVNVDHSGPCVTATTIP